MVDSNVRYSTGEDKFIKMESYGIPTKRTKKKQGLHCLYTSSNDGLPHLGTDYWVI